MTLRIRLMKDEDIAFALSLTDRERWGYLRADFERLLAIEPEGCFVAVNDGQPAGIISTTAYGEYAFIGSLIVIPQMRRTGIGEALMQHALEYLRSAGARSIELDGTFPAVPLYRRLGFKDKYLSLRLFRPSNQQSASPDITWHEPGFDNWKQDVIELDRRLSGLNRGRLLTRIFSEPSRSLFTCSSTRPSGYARVYPRAENRLAVGPLMAADDATAIDLWDMIVERHGDRILTAGVPETNRPAIDLLRVRGFLHLAPSLRMYLGDRRDYESSVFAIVSAEKG